MTPRSLYTQFHLTEITYAKVCTVETECIIGLGVCAQTAHMESYQYNSISILG